jgi:hypothetical protein
VDAQFRLRTVQGRDQHVFCVRRPGEFRHDIFPVGREGHGANARTRGTDIHPAHRRARIGIARLRIRWNFSVGCVLRKSVMGYSGTGPSSRRRNATGPAVGRPLEGARGAGVRELFAIDPVERAVENEPAAIARQLDLPRLGHVDGERLFVRTKATHRPSGEKVACSSAPAARVRRRVSPRRDTNPQVAVAADKEAIPRGVPLITQQGNPTGGSAAGRLIQLDLLALVTS